MIVKQPASSDLLIHYIAIEKAHEWVQTFICVISLSQFTLSVAVEVDQAFTAIWNNACFGIKRAQIAQSRIVKLIIS